VTEFRHEQIERAIKEQRPEGGAEQVGAAHYLGDPHGGVIDDDGKLVGGRSSFRQMTKSLKSIPAPARCRPAH
jgi:hypothetical protein